MKVALIGASGFVGKILLKELAHRGHTVTAIARNSDKIERTHNVTPVSADVNNVDELSQLLQGHDAVISSYNPGWTNPNMYNDFLAGAQSIQEAVKKSGVKRLITIGGAGSLYIAPDQQLVDTVGFPEEWKPGALAARDYLNILKDETLLDWTFVSPAIEMHQGTSGSRKGTYRKALENPVVNDEGRSIISAEDLSVAIVDELEDPKHIRQRFTVAY